MRVAIVNDLSLAVEALRRVLTESGEHEVLWVARNGREAIEKCRSLRPDVVLMDLIMPGVGGVEATREIMHHTPCPILVVTASVGDHAGLVFQALGAGALDAVSTPVLSPGKLPRGSAALLAKLAQVGRTAPAHLRETRPVATRRKPAGPEAAPPLVAVGASAGGPAALATLLRALPRNLPAAVVIIQHIDASFAPLMAGWLAEQAAMPVRLATHGEPPLPGTALVAGTNHHLVLNARGHLAYTSTPQEVSYHPSVDVFFDSVADHWRGLCIGVLLTGMGKDGARGLKRLRDQGAYTIAQDMATSAVYGMPKAAAELNAAIDVLALDHIAPQVVQRLTSSHHE